MRDVDDQNPSTLHLIVSVNVALPRTIRYFQHTVVTGIFKAPITGPVFIRHTNIEGDGQADTRVINGSQVHGGRLKAAYLYAAEHYAYWQAELQRSLPYGQFGENLTVEGILEDIIHEGDILKAGEATLRVTQPRLPCYKLDIRMELPEFRKRFLASGRTGFYAEVLEEGQVQTGDVVERITTQASSPTILDLAKRTQPAEI